MPKIINSFFEKNKNYSEYIKQLEIVTGKPILKKLQKTNDEINFFSIISEIKFGKYLVDIFGDTLRYEPSILGKTPDWFVEINGDKIIFEVLRINPPNDKFQNKIDSYLVNGLSTNSSGVFIGLGCLNLTDLKKILKKEETYKELIEFNDYKLVICIDASDWDKKIDVLDINYSFDFENDNSPLYYEFFTRNVTGLMVEPYFGSIKFIINNNVKKKLNVKNLDVLKCHLLNNHQL